MAQRFGKFLRNNAQSIPNDDWAEIEWDLVVIDSPAASFFDPAHPERLNLLMGALYTTLVVQIRWSPDSTASKKRGVRILQYTVGNDGVTVTSQERGRVMEPSIEQGSGDSNSQCLVTFDRTIRLPNQSWVAVEVYQDSGSALDVSFGSVSIHQED